MEIGQRVRARFLTVPQMVEKERAKEKDIYPIRLGEIVWIHPKGRLVSVKTTVRGGQITETFRPWEVMPE